MLSMRPNCECCDRDLAQDAGEASVCSFACTFCAGRASRLLGGVCPNCGGAFARRPRRPAAMLANYPASAEQVLKAGGCAQAI
jgi:uncharacterized protein